MSKLLERIKELPTGDRVEISSVTDSQQEVDNAEADKGAQKLSDVADKQADAKEAPAAEQKSEKEPGPNAPKKEVEAYRQRKIKEADAEREAEKKEAESAKRERDEARRETEALKRENAEWERIATGRRATQPQQQPQPKAEAPNWDKNPRGVVENVAASVRNVEKAVNDLNANNTRREAVQYLEGLEAKFAASNPDYHAAIKWGEDRMVAKERAMNPNVDESAVREQFQINKLRAASQMHVNKHDPVKGLYDFFVADGYVKAAPATAKDDAKDDKGDRETKNFDAAKKNKKGATPLAAGGRSAGSTTTGPEDSKGLSLRQFAKLSKADKEAMYPSG